MTNPMQTNGQQRQSVTTDLFVWLGRNPVQVVVLLVLIGGGVTVFLFQAQNSRKDAKKAVVAAKPKWTDKNWQESRYFQEDCTKNPQCRQLKRIYEEGGASQEALRKHMLEVDKTLTFEQLQENAETYEGRAWAFEGKIVNILWKDKRGVGDYILAEIIVGDDPAKLLSMRGDFATDVALNDNVYVVGYITGTSRHRLGPSGLKYSGKVPDLSVRALLKPSAARELLARNAAN